MNGFSLLFGGKRSRQESRWTLDQVYDWVKSTGGNFMSGAYATGGKTEEIGNNFEAYVSQAYQQNGIVFACAVARMMVFAEARIMYQRMSNGRPGDYTWDNSLRMFERPWPSGTTSDLFKRAIQDADTAGNHFVYTSGVGQNKRLRWMRPDWVSIILSAPPEEASETDIEGYVYKPGGTQDVEKWKILPVDGSNGRVAHWAPIPDPMAQFRGMSWMTPVLREIIADKSISDHKSKYFTNAATPSIAVSLNDSVTPDQFALFMEKFQETMVGTDNAYKPLYLGGGADVTVIGSDLGKMDFRSVQGVGETRIAAAARVHPVIVGLSEGMQGSSLNAGNYGTAKRNFADGTLRPLWGSLMGAYGNLLEEKRGKRLWYDPSDVAFLRDDEKDIAEIQKVQSSTITQYTRDGFTWESAVDAVVHDDPRKLKHTGLYSVQLQKPGADGDPSTEDGGKDKEPVDDGKDDEPADDSTDTEGDNKDE